VWRTVLFICVSCCYGLLTYFLPDFFVFIYLFIFYFFNLAGADGAVTAGAGGA